MNRKRIILFIVIIIIALLFLGAIGKKRNKPSPPHENTVSQYGPGDYDFSLEHDDLTRSYLVHVPISYNKNKPVPVIIAFHGGGGNAEESPTYFGLNDPADKEGFIVVYPKGTGKSAFGKDFATWNAGKCCSDADDVGFVDKMIEKLETDFNIDEKRIFVTGFSNGGRMAYRVACEMPDKIAAAAPMGSTGTIECPSLARPVPFFFFDGTADHCTPFEGGEKCGACFNEFLNKIGIPIPIESYACDPSEKFVKKLVALDDCSDVLTTTYQKGNTTCLTYSECKGDAEVVYCVTQGGGHNWPGQKEYTIAACKSNPNGDICKYWKESVGPLIPDFDANEQIWEFFKKHPIE